MTSPESKNQVQLIDRALMADLLEKAQSSPRRRINHNFHSSLEDNPHRFLNVLLKGTYIAPHRHLTPPKAESFLVLEGSLIFYIFNDEGDVIETHPLDSGAGNLPLGIDIAPGVWHNLVVKSEHAVCYEVKPGPYIPSTDKEFAPWAPVEGDAGCDDYLRRLLKINGG